MTDRSEVAGRAVGENPAWYHSIELAPGVLTPGQVDLRRAAERILPADMSGLRALDVGTYDGFWAFEMERRGAEVVAVDTPRLSDNDWPPISRPRLEAEAERRGLELGLGFRLAAEALGSRARRIAVNVHDLSTEAIGGPVDFAFSGAILLHLRDPVGALERIGATLRGGGELRLMEPLHIGLSLRFPRRPVARFRAHNSEFNWWEANVAALGAWCEASGFERVRRIGFLRPPATKAMRQPYLCLSCEKPVLPSET